MIGIRVSSFLAVSLRRVGSPVLVSITPSSNVASGPLPSPSKIFFCFAEFPFEGPFLSSRFYSFLPPSRCLLVLHFEDPSSLFPHSHYWRTPLFSPPHVAALVRDSFPAFVLIEEFFPSSVDGPDSYTLMANPLDTGVPFLPLLRIVFPCGFQRTPVEHPPFPLLDAYPTLFFGGLISNLLSSSPPNCGFPPFFFFSNR